MYARMRIYVYPFRLVEASCKEVGLWLMKGCMECTGG